MRHHRKVIRIRAEDSPNVRRGLEMRRRGLVPDHKIVLAGVLTLDEFDTRRATWSEPRQCVGLDGEFYEGKEELLFPPEWLNAASRSYERIPAGVKRVAKGGGSDPAEGGDKTTLCAVDEWGVIELVSLLTPDTNKIPGMVIGFLQKHQIPSDRFCFDRGGGGKQHADRLRAQGFPVRTVGFGEPVTPELRRGMTPFSQRKDQRETGYEYKSRRVQMYWEASELIDPSSGIKPFAIPHRGTAYDELNRQLGFFPKLYDDEGRAHLPPKNPKPGRDRASKGRAEKSLVELIGNSPDEADAFVLAIHGMLHRDVQRSRAGVA